MWEVSSRYQWRGEEEAERHGERTQADVRLHHDKNKVLLGNTDSILFLPPPVP